VPDVTSLASRVRQFGRNTPLAASVAVRRLSVDPTDTAVRLAERLPSRLLARARSRREVALLLAEDDAAALAAVEGAGPAPGAGALRRLVSVATSPQWEGVRMTSGLRAQSRCRAFNVPR